MSWLISLINAPPEAVTLDDLPEDFSSVLGSYEQVIGELAALFPELSFPSAGMAILEGDHTNIEFTIGEDDPVGDLLLDIVAGDEEALDLIEKICKTTGWQAFDHNGERFIDFSGSQDGETPYWDESEDWATVPLSRRVVQSGLLLQVLPLRKKIQPLAPNEFGR